MAMCAKSHHNIIYFRNFDLALNLVIARRTMPDVAMLRLSRKQIQVSLNYAEEEQGRPKVNLLLKMAYSHGRYCSLRNELCYAHFPNNRSITSASVQDS